MPLPSLQSAKAALESASINIDKLTPLVANNVVSDVQLKSAKAAHDAAKANVSQAQAAVDAAKINIGYTSIKAPADGYIGTIPFKSGSLVGKGYYGSIDRTFRNERNSRILLNERAGFSAV
jgi:membrane fusion protein (multidrug efflux system)